MDSKKSKIAKIDNNNLCLGCGLCESICGNENVEMILSEDGFFHPNVKKIVEDKEDIITRICPGINIDNDIKYKKDQSIWGKIISLKSGYSTDSQIRKKGSSGGVVSAISLYLLEQNLVNGILQVGGDPLDYKQNSLRISKTKTDILTAASSRYAPALVFIKIKQILEDSDDIYCFVGKPCDVSGLKNFLKEFPQYKTRFRFIISIICAGIPSFKGTQSIIDNLKGISPVKDLVYRGNGWPGSFSFRDSNGDFFQQSYNDSWGKTLNKHLNFRCKVCPDGIGLQADISVGDAWETHDGYPDFSEKEGQSLIIVRTDYGAELLNRIEAEGYIITDNIPENRIRAMQPFQYGRRTRVGARLLAFYIVKKQLLNYKNLSLFYNMRFVKLRTLVKEFVGTFKRLMK